MNRLLKNGLTCIGLLVLSSQALAAQKLALIIGNSQYDGVMGALQNPINDAQAIDKQLKQLGFKTTLVKNANKLKMLEAIDEFSNQISRGDTVLFYYAGHGASANGNNYLIPIGAQSPKNDKWFDENFIDLDTKIASVLSQSEAAYKLVVMDACRDNPIAKTRSSGTRTFARTDQSQNAKGLAFLYSASKGQQAQDGGFKGNSPFTLALVKQLSKPNAIWPVLVEEVTDEVRESTRGQQEVWAEGNTLAKLVLNPQDVIVEPKPSPTLVDTELSYWESIKNSTNASDYAAYLADYPRGRFASLAKSRQKQYEVKPIEPSPKIDTELSYWESIKNSTNASDYAAYLADYPRGRFASLAKSRQKQYQAKPNLEPLQIAQIQVRDNPSTSQSYSDDELVKKGIWRDPKTNLVWMRCSLGQTWNGKTCTGEAKTLQWQEAKDAAQALNNNGGFGGYKDWVVPHIEDLSTIRYCSTGFEETTHIPAKGGGTKTVDGRCKGYNFQRPTIDQTIFPNTKHLEYWSRSPVADSSYSAWIVNFRSGDSDGGNKYSNSYVRLILSSQ